MRRRGYTLIEICVASACFLLMLSGLYVVYVLGLRYLRMAETQSRLQQQAALAMQKLTLELSLGVDDTGGVTTGSSPGYVTFLSSVGTDGTIGYDPSGKLQWKNWVCYFQTDSQLSRTEIPVSGGPIVRPFSTLTPPNLGVFQAVIGDYRKSLSDCLDTFTVSHTAAGVCHITLITSLPGLDGSKPCKTQLATDVFLINN